MFNFVFTEPQRYNVLAMLNSVNVHEKNINGNYMMCSFVFYGEVSGGFPEQLYKGSMDNWGRTGMLTASIRMTLRMD
jgi:hypothetical protein